MSVRTGIGVSIMHHGELYTGFGGFDGEIGHTVIDPSGPKCDCGNRGCLQAFIGAPAICDHASRLIASGRCARLQRASESGEALRPELIYSLARDGDQESAEIVRSIGRYLGVAISNLVNLLAPHEVIICGSIDTAGELFLAALREHVIASALPRSRQNLVFRLARQQDRMALYGAAAMVAQEAFRLPKLRHQPFGFALRNRMAPASGTGTAESGGSDRITESA